MVQLAYSTSMSRETYLEEFFLGFGMVCRYEYEDRHQEYAGRD